MPDSGPTQNKKNLIGPSVPFYTHAINCPRRETAERRREREREREKEEAGRILRGERDYIDRTLASRLFTLRRIERMPTTRFKKGNKVEVWNTREVPSGSWWSAEIISGNGHSYSVRYDGYPIDSRMAVDRVPRKAIRPCPPPLEDQRELQIGDFVEVFDKNSWKIAEVRMIFSNGYCSMRLLGSSRKFQFHKSNIRRQLSWQDNKWMVIHKDLGEESDGQLSISMKGGRSVCHMPQSCEKMKRRPLDMSVPADACNIGRKKMRAMKVEFLASTGKILGEKYTDYSLSQKVGPSRIESERRMLHSDKENYLLNSSVRSDAESTSSSVGSCSVDSSHEEYYSQYDYVETSCGFERDSAFSRKGELQTEIHQLELSAYRSTLKAFYASGPGQSWSLLNFASIGL